MDFENIKQASDLGADIVKHRVGTAFSAKKNPDEVFRAMLIEANNGKDHIDLRDIRDGKCGALFSIVETVIQKTINEGLTNNAFFNALVEEKEVAEGDKASFFVEDNTYLTVAEVSEGTQGLIRQRIETGHNVEVPTKYYGIKIYEELNRILAGRANISDYIPKVADAFSRHDLDNMYANFNAMVSTLDAPYKQTGTFDEKKMLTLAEHIEASTGMASTLLGTNVALMNLELDKNTSDSANESIYNNGYLGKFRGINVVKIPQRHAINTDNFVFADNRIYVMAGGDKPIKHVTEGTPLIINSPLTANADLSQEYAMYNKTGTAIVSSSKGIGYYEFA